MRWTGLTAQSRRTAAFTSNLFAAPAVSGASLRPSRPPGDRMIRTVFADVRYGLRVLFHAPSFTMAVVAVLALGVGANTAIFSTVNTVRLRPLPYKDRRAAREPAGCVSRGPARPAAGVARLMG